MSWYETSEPVEIADRLLWRDAQQMLHRHSERGSDGRCGWCGWHWPCPPRRLAERAEAACHRPWQSGVLPMTSPAPAGAAPAAVAPAGVAPARVRASRNRRPFD